MGRRGKQDNDLNQKIIFISHPKRSKPGASHFHQQFQSQKNWRRGKVKEERKQSVKIAENTEGFSRVDDG